MAKAKPWLKMWAEWIGDPKMDSLSLGEQAAWWRLTTLAHQCAAEGALIEGGLPMSLEAIMKTLKISDEADKATFKSMVEKMKVRGSLHFNSNALVVTHYKDRQEMVPSNMPDAVAARQRKHREKLGKVVPPLESSKVTPPSTKEEEVEVEVEVEERRDVTTETSQKTRDRILAEVSRLYSENISDKITGPIADELRDFADSFHGEFEWISLAFGEALSLNKKSWRYIRTILEEWQLRGGPNGRAAEKLRRQRGIKAHQRGPVKSWTKPPSAEEYRRGTNV